MRNNKPNWGEKDLHNLKSEENTRHEERYLAEKTAQCYSRIEKLVLKEMENGKTLEEAISIVQNSPVLEKMFHQLKDDKVKRTVFRFIRINCYNKNKKNEEIGEER